MSQAAKAQEPSMEEILASIRRIIADDETAKAPKPPEPKPAAKAPEPKPAAPAPPPAPPGPGMNQEDIDAMLAGFDKVEEPPPPPPAEEPAEPDVLELTEAMAEPPANEGFKTVEPASDVMFNEEPAESEPPAPLESSLLSATTTSAVNSAFHTLAHTVLNQNARTLEDLVKEMLRPMLKAWLDDNLPNLVERMVRAEIERVSRGR